MPISFHSHWGDTQNDREEELRCEAPGCTEEAVGTCTTKSCYCQVCVRHLVMRKNGDKCGACWAEEKCAAASGEAA
jgi:hypothetical protein